MRLRGRFSAVSLRLLATLGLLFVPGYAAAQDVALVATTAGEGVDAELGPSIDGALREAAVDAGLEVRSEAALDLAELQLALGCEGDACLSAVASELGAAELLVPRLRAAGAELVLTIDRFDAASASMSATAERRALSSSVGQLLDEMNDMVRELFGLEEVPLEEPAEPAVDPVVEPEPSGPDGGRAAAAGVIAGLGVVALGVGFGVGAASQDAAQRYADHPLETPQDAADALAELRSAQDQATVANVMFVVGGALAAAGVTWLVIELAIGGSDDASATLSPVIGDGLAGVSVQGRLR